MQPVAPVMLVKYHFKSTPSLYNLYRLYNITAFIYSTEYIGIMQHGISQIEGNTRH